MGALFSDIIELFVTEKYQFVAVFAVVIVDLIFGVFRAFKQGEFQTRKAFKSLWMLGGFWLLLATVLLIEKGYHIASFLSEAILLPILLFQIISIVKNMHLLGLISGGLLTRILQNIDNHKDVTNTVINE